jgi:hypothetical protein
LGSFFFADRCRLRRSGVALQHVSAHFEFFKVNARFIFFKICHAVGAKLIPVGVGEGKNLSPFIAIP